MEIEYLSLNSYHFEDQRCFYNETLALPCTPLADDAFEVKTHHTRLIFRHSEQVQYYHFAFLIPEGTLAKAIAYLESRGVELLLLDGEKIVHFNPGRAVYFKDADGNIVEWIERPSVHDSRGINFSPENLVCINEVGFPVQNPMETAHELMEDYGIVPANQDGFSDEFCWVGDARGVLIVVKKGRHWLPTDIPSVSNQFKIRYRSNDRMYHLDIDGDKIESVETGK